MDFITRRIITSLVVFFAAINLDFFLPRFIPGNAADVFASKPMGGAEYNLVVQRLGLNLPPILQYFHFLEGIFTNWPPFFGFSYQYFPATVSGLIFSRIGWTILLLVVSLILAIGISFTVGALSSMKRGGKLEFSALYVSVLAWSTPAFFLGLSLIWIFGVTFKVLPQFGQGGYLVTGTLPYIESVIQHAILPVATMTSVIYGQSFLILRGATIQVLGSDYITSARARGLRERTIAFKYVIRNSLLPLVSLSGYAVAYVISILVAVEFVFGYQGIGDLMVDGIISRDYPVIEGCFFYITLIVIILAFIGDLMLLKLDPTLKK
ncbi:MAG: ABC transporter permease [Nitrososphaerales archaeon]